jgi:hypothetical protein
MKTEESLYIKVLLWAYYRQESGFTWGELHEEFHLSEEQKRWIEMIFRSNMPSSENLIDHIYNSSSDTYQYFITAKGTSAAIQYLNLKEAESSGKRAEKIALAAIGIGVLVGIAQILVQLCIK